MKPHTFWLLTAGFAALLLALCLVVVMFGRGLTGHPVACATYQDQNQIWHEPDGEILGKDDDPCDMDDLFESDKKQPKPKTSTKRR